MKGVVAGKNRVSATCQSTTKVSSRDKRQTRRRRVRRNGRLCQLLYAVPEPLFHDRGAWSAHLLHRQRHLSKRFSLAACVQSGDRSLCVS